MSNDTPHLAFEEPFEILLVEDNPGDVRSVREAFEAVDSEIALNVITDGDTAVAELLHPAPGDSIPDLVLLDLNLPGRDGCAVLEAIRDDSDIPTLPVLMLSSSSTDEDVARCYDANANAYLTKPGTLSELQEMMKSVNEFWVEKTYLPPVSA